MEIVKIINNNIVSALDDENKEIVVMGKGLGFHTKAGQKIPEERIEKIFRLNDESEKMCIRDRQLLSIARAAVANPPVLILDEATSSIDTRTESIVQKGMDNLMKGRTVFVIAHRLSTIRNSDAIIVLEHGKIIERGDHEDLIQMKGTYYQLYTGKLELS